VSQRSASWNPIPTLCCGCTVSRPLYKLLYVEPAVSTEIGGSSRVYCHGMLLKPTQPPSLNVMSSPTPRSQDRVFLGYTKKMLLKLSVRPVVRAQ